MFGEKVKLTYKGRKSFKTIIGASMSIVVKIIMSAYISYELYVIFNRTHPKVAVKQTLNDFAVNPRGPIEEWSPFELGFDFAIGLINASTSLSSGIDSQFGNL